MVTSRSHVPRGDMAHGPFLRTRHLAMLQWLAVRTDRELLERWCAGDRLAGNQLFQRHFDSISAFFETKVERDVDELVQSTFMACVQSIDSFRLQSSFRTFLFAIARRKLYRYYRTKRRHGDRFDFNVTSVAELQTGVRTKLGRVEEHQQLLDALSELPVEQQILLELFYWEGMDGAELAEVLEISPATVRSRLHRARAALRKRVEERSRAPKDATQNVADFDAWARRVRDQHHR